MPNSNISCPYFFIGDAAFTMTPNFMRPYPGRHLDEKRRIFNYRLSRARRCIENTFGILAARWKIFFKPIGLDPKHVDKVVLACVCLHNFVMARTQKSVRNMYIPKDFIDNENENRDVNDGLWRQEVPRNVFGELHNIDARRSRTIEAHKVRENLAEYFITPKREVSWQYEYISRGLYRDM